MKLVHAIIQPHKLTDVKESLAKAGVTKMTVTTALGCGNQKGFPEGYRGTVYEVNLLKKVAIEIAINDDFVEPTVKAICDGARTGNIGDGKIFIADLIDAVRIRTGERGREAIG